MNAEADGKCRVIACAQSHEEMIWKVALAYDTNVERKMIQMNEPACLQISILRKVNESRASFQEQASVSSEESHLHPDESIRHPPIRSTKLASSGKRLASPSSPK
jgi:hypothetical protein